MGCHWSTSSTPPTAGIPFGSNISDIRLVTLVHILVVLGECFYIGTDIYIVLFPVYWRGYTAFPDSSLLNPPLNRKFLGGLSLVPPLWAKPFLTPLGSVFFFYLSLLGSGLPNRLYDNDDKYLISWSLYFKFFGKHFQEFLNYELK